jgi:hypothetical protein
MNTSSLCVCSIFRTIAIFDCYWGTYDTTWAAQGAWMWLSVEAVVAVICASVPALKTLFTHARKPSSQNSREGSASSGPTLAESQPYGMRELKAWDSEEV